ncbi:MAG: hypothetical protein NVSMB18_37020 [Acetobacteraceae bacterium]
MQVGVVVVAGMYFAREVLIPITLAVLLSFILAPAVRWLRRFLPRVLAVLLAVVFALAIVLSLGGLIGTQVASLVGQVPRYTETVQAKISSVQNYAVGHVAGILSSLPGLGQGAEPAAPPPSNPAATAATPERAAPVPVEVHEPDPTPLTVARRVLDPILSPLSTTAIVFVFSVFILLQQDDLRERLIRLFGSGDLHRTTAALDDAGQRLSRYFLAQLGVNVVFGCVIGAGLYVIGVPSPLLWGVLGGLLRFVPYLGSFLAGALPIALAAAVDPGWGMALKTAALFVVCEGVTGQVIEPMLYGRSTGLSPFAVVVAATFWTWLWGPVGLLLSTPLTLCLVVMGRHAKPLEFLDVMLGDRPALTPVEAFYQRVLAGDPDDLLEQAELLLKDRPLSSYYDEVAMKGLQLAAHDLERGVLDPEQLEVVKHTTTALVADLGRHQDRDPEPRHATDHGPTPSIAEQELPKRSAPAVEAPDDDTLPPEWRAETAVLCLAGRGPLDEAASTILAQLLQKHGLGARVIGNEAASRGSIGQLDVTGVAMVCVSYLEISGSPSHLRYLIRRLRERLPGRRVLVGLWPAEDAVLSEKRIQGVIGADHYTSSLKAAVECCLEQARQAADGKPLAA